MHFEEGYVYHVYNQGNNSQKLFFSRENYLFFTKKIRTHILPHADILAWCLMPNHFHLMVYVHTPVITRDGIVPRDATLSRVPRNGNPTTLNKSIGILLASYTRAIHKQQNISGSLFRKHTKSINLTKTNKITPAYFNTQFGTKINIFLPRYQAVFLRQVKNRFFTFNF